MTFGEKCRKYRTALGLTQEQTAKSAGISRRTYSYYESGQKYPRQKETVEKLAALFGTESRFLIIEDDDDILLSSDRQQRMNRIMNDLRQLAEYDADDETVRQFFRSVSEFCKSFANI